MVVPEHGPRDGGTYGEQLVTLLDDAGVPATVTHAARWFGRITELIPRYESDVRNPFPDVLVLHYGMVECQSNLLPRTIVRHLTTWHRTSRASALGYRRYAAPQVWRALRRYQRAVSGHDQFTHRLSPRRFMADTRRIIDLARVETGALVLLVDIDPPGPRVEYWLPGTTERAAHYNRLLAEIADGYDDGVRLVRASAQLTDVDAQLPDGLHRTRAGHALTAKAIRDEILSWMAQRVEQP